MADDGSGTGGDANPGGQQGALSSEQLTQLEGRLTASMNTALSGALTARLKGLGLDELREQIKTLGQSGNGTSTPATPPAADPGTGTNSDRITQLEATIRNQGKEILLERGKTLMEKRSNRLRTAFSGLDVREGMPLADAVEALVGRDDIKFQVDSTGQPVWSGRIPGELGDLVDAPIEDVCRQFLKGREHYLKPRGGGGSGAGGGTAAGLTVGGKSIDQMTEAQAEALSPEEKAKVFATLSGGSRTGFFND